MRKTLSQSIAPAIVLFMVFGFLKNAQSVSSSRDQSFCVQTFNAYGAFYAADIAQRTRESAVQMSLDSCNVIQLQEVFNRNRMNMFQHFAEVLSSTHQNVPIGLTTSSGLQSFLKGEVLDQDFHRFKVQTLVGIRKGFSTIRSRVHGITGEVMLVNIHLHHSSSESRLSQLEEFISWRHKNPQLPMILTGDLNSNPGSIEYDLVTTTLRLNDSAKTAFGNEYPSGYCTYCAENPRSWDGFLSSKGPQDQTYDYIFTSNSATSTRQLVPVSASVNLRGRPGFTWSDHYGVQVFFREQRKASIAGQKNQVAVSEAKAKLESVLQRLRAANRYRTTQGILIVEKYVADLEKEGSFLRLYISGRSN